MKKKAILLIIGGALELLGSIGTLLSLVVDNIPEKKEDKEDEEA